MPAAPRVPDTTGSGDALPLGDVGLLHPSSSDTSGPAMASEAARLQNVRRVWV
jgi:hypothetical protein